MSIMNSFVIDIFERIANESAKLVQYRKSSQISEMEIKSAVKLILPGELCTISLSEGAKHLARYKASAQQRKDQKKLDKSMEESMEE